MDRKTKQARDPAGWLYFLGRRAAARHPARVVYHGEATNRSQPLAGGATRRAAVERCATGRRDGCTGSRCWGPGGSRRSTSRASWGMPGRSLPAWSTSTGRPPNRWRRRTARGRWTPRPRSPTRTWPPSSSPPRPPPTRTTSRRGRRPGNTSSARSPSTSTADGCGSASRTSKDPASSSSSASTGASTLTSGTSSPSSTRARSGTSNSSRSPRAIRGCPPQSTSGRPAASSGT